MTVVAGSRSRACVDEGSLANEPGPSPTIVRSPRSGSAARGLNHRARLGNPDSILIVDVDRRACHRFEQPGIDELVGSSFIDLHLEPLEDRVDQDQVPAKLALNRVRHHSDLRRRGGICKLDDVRAQRLASEIAPRRGGAVGPHLGGQGSEFLSSLDAILCVDRLLLGRNQDVADAGDGRIGRQQQFERRRR